MEKQSNWFKRKLIDPILNLLKQGVEPHKLALAISLAFTLGFFPVFGAHSLLCLLVIWLFRLNPAAVFLVNNLAYPLIFALYLPQIRLGEWMFNAPPFSFQVTEVIELVSSKPLQAIKDLWDATMHAIAAWCLIAIIATPLLYFVLRAIFTRLRLKGFDSIQPQG